MASSLHNRIGDFLMKEFSDKVDVILDQKCGTGKSEIKQNIPIFMDKPKSNSTEISNVDAKK